MTTNPFLPLGPDIWNIPVHKMFLYLLPGCHGATLTRMVLKI
jgi:hypothetical protein